MRYLKGATTPLDAQRNVLLRAAGYGPKCIGLAKIRSPSTLQTLFGRPLALQTRKKHLQLAAANPPASYDVLSWLVQHRHAEPGEPYVPSLHP